MSEHLLIELGWRPRLIRCISCCAGYAAAHAGCAECVYDGGPCLCAAAGGAAAATVARAIPHRCAGLCSGQRPIGGLARAVISHRGADSG